MTDDEIRERLHILTTMRKLKPFSRFTGISWGTLIGITRSYTKREDGKRSINHYSKARLEKEFARLDALEAKGHKPLDLPQYAPLPGKKTGVKK